MRHRISQNLMALLHDAFMASASFALALYLRLGQRTLSFAGDFLIEGSIIFTFVLLTAMLTMRSYRHVWRYTALNDLVLIAKAGSFALIAFYVLMFGLTRLEGIPRSVPFIHWMTLMLCLMAGRVFWRVLHDGALISRLMGSNSTRIPVLLIGATSQAEIFIRESARSSEFPYVAVGLVDDNARQHGREIHHVRVYGGVSEIAYILRKLARKGKAVQRLIVTEPNLSAAEFKALLAVAETHHLTLARLPSLSELKAGDRLHDIRPIAVEDILGRPQAVLDRPAMRAFVAGKRVLVTGAGGSIGSELVRQVATCAPSELVLFDISEYQLYLIDQELGETAPTITRHAVLGDVRDSDHLAHIFRRFTPEVVFHAAAIKHVPLAEQNPEQAVLTNILGSKNVADACVAHHVATMIQISTDKAALRDGGHQARRRNLWPDAGTRWRSHPLCHRALWQCAQFRRLRRPALSKTNRARWAGHRHAQGYGALFHEHQRGRAIGVASRRAGCQLR
jgi:FlaA1/EpsC-like NDP-sugar epimerase